MFFWTVALFIVLTITAMFAFLGAELIARLLLVLLLALFLFCLIADLKRMERLRTHGDPVARARQAAPAARLFP